MTTLNDYQLKNDEVVQLRVALIARIDWLVDRRESYKTEKDNDYINKRWHNNKFYINALSKELYICQKLLAMLDK